MYFVCFALVVDFNRGDWGGTFYSLAVVGGAYWFMTLVARLKWVRQPAGPLWTPQAVSADATANPGR